MRPRNQRLIDEIERDALSRDVPVSDTLRKLLTLGGQAGSQELREWASLELRGYGGSGAELPEYRKPGAVLQVNAVNGRYVISGQQISPRNLPEGIRGQIGEEVPLGQAIGEIEALAEQARANDGHIKLALMHAQDVAALLNYERQDHPYQQITAVYWSVSQAALEGVIDRVRTALVELVAEMRAGMPEAADAPSAEVADQAVNVAVYGRGNRVSVAAAQAGVAGSQDIRVAPSESASRWRKIGGTAVGVATIVGAAVGLAK